MNEKYDELKREAKKIEKKIMDAEDALAKEGVSFEEMVEKTRKDRIELFKLSKEMRLIQDPGFQPKKKWKGKFMTMENFIKMCNEEHITDEDGYGFYADKKIVTDIKIFPSDIMAEMYRKDFTEILWFFYADEEEKKD